MDVVLGEPRHHGAAAQVHDPRRAADRLLHVGAAADAQLLVGLAGLVLGILGLIGIKAMTLVLVALLAIGASALLRSSALGGFMLDVLRR